MRYPRVGGRRQRHFAGTNLEPYETLENAATPTRRVHAVLARTLEGYKAYKNNHLFLQRPSFLLHFDIRQVIRQGTSYVGRSLLPSISFPFDDLVFPLGPILYISSSVYFPVKTSLTCSSE